MIDWSLALWAGVVGGVAMTVMMTLARMMGMVNVNMAMYQGCMITKKDQGAGTWTAGFLMHLMIAAVIAVAYAWRSRRSGAARAGCWGWSTVSCTG